MIKSPVDYVPFHVRASEMSERPKRKRPCRGHAILIGRSRFFLFLFLPLDFRLKIKKMDYYQATRRKQLIRGCSLCAVYAYYSIVIGQMTNQQLTHSVAVRLERL